MVRCEVQCCILLERFSIKPWLHFFSILLNISFSEQCGMKLIYTWQILVPILIDIVNFFPISNASGTNQIMPNQIRFVFCTWYRRGKRFVFAYFFLVWSETIFLVWSETKNSFLFFTDCVSSFPIWKHLFCFRKFKGSYIAT